MDKRLYVEYLPGEKHPGNIIEKSYDLTNFQDAGIILLDHEVVVDIDEIGHETIKALLATFKINTKVVWTDRGAHLYFRSTRSRFKKEAVIPLGFKVEYKTNRNSKNGVTIKKNGVLRHIENENKLQELPDILMYQNGLDSLLGLSDGDGRNNRLHAHKVKIHKLPNNYQILKFINEYIFAEPLSDKEFETVAREEEIDIKKLDEIACAELFIQQNKVKIFSGLPWVFDGSRYQTGEDDIKRLICQTFPDKLMRQYTEIFQQMKLRAPKIKHDGSMIIKFKNAYLLDDTIYHDKDGKNSEFTPYYIDVNYNSQAEPVESVENYLNHMSQGDPNYRNLFLEMLGYTFITDPEVVRYFTKFFILVGRGGTGKGTALEIIRKIIGDNNCSTLGLERFGDDSFLVMLKGKLVNLGDDIKNEPIDDDKMKNLKNVSSADAFPVRDLYQSAENVRYTTKMIFTSNHKIKSFEKGDAFERRVVWLPMDNKVKEVDPFFISKLTTPEAMEYWIRLLVEAVQRLYKNMAFTSSKIVDDFNKIYHRENNSVIEFCEDIIEDDRVDMIEGQTLSFVQERYLKWCLDNGMKEMGRQTMNDTIKNMMGLSLAKTRQGGVQKRVYKKTE